MESLTQSMPDELPQAARAEQSADLNNRTVTMRFDTRLLTLAKDPEQSSAYQDASCFDAEHGIATIADGVSSALFSGPWAAILAEAAVADSPNPHDADAFATWLEAQRRRWAASIDTSSLAWFQKAKLPAGAFSTLLYLRAHAVENSHEGSFGGYRLMAYAVGDSCLFQIRGGELVRTFPMQTAEQFEADPIVLGSVDLKRDHLLEFAFLDEMCYPGDQLVLCTDALAEWAVRSYETGDPPSWDDFWQMSDDDWRSGIAWLRQERQMRVDDTTMLLLRVVDERVAVESDSESSPNTSHDDKTEFGWLHSASKEIKSVSSQVAEQADQASERMLQGFMSLKEKALQKYREKFRKKNDPP